MPEFRYKALTQDSQSVTGVVDALNRAAAITSLAQQGNYVLDIEQSAAESDAGGLISLRRRAARVSPRAKLAMLRQLAVALESGLTLLTALRVVHQQSENVPVKQLTHDLCERVQAGESLSQAMKTNARHFSPLEVSMVRVGETAGVLDEVMTSLAEFAERDMDIREKLRSASTYPLIVLGLGAISIVVILTFILPRIMAAVTDTNSILPWPTRTLLGISDFLTSPIGWLSFVALLLAGWMARQWMQRPQGRLAVDRFKLRVPLLGTAIRRVAVARFARTLGTLTKSGIHIVEAMQVIRGTLGNEELAQQIDKVTRDIAQGQSIAEPLRQTGQFPPLLIQVIAMGERTGKLDELLLHTANSYDKETAVTLQRLMTVIPVLFILGLAVVVIFILAAVLLPIVNMDVLSGV